MDSFELNKIFGAITGSLLIFFSLTFLSEAIYHPGGHGDEEPIAFMATSAEEPVVVEAPAEPTPLPVLLAAADLGKGERIFKKCAGCHNATEGGANGVGPNLWAVMGRAIGGKDGYAYSDALAGHGGAWDWEAMNGFLTAPKEWAPGTKMNYNGLARESERADLMAWLNAQSGAPLDLPAE